LHGDAGTAGAQAGPLRDAAGWCRDPAAGWTWTVEQTEKGFREPGTDTGTGKATTLIKAIEPGLRGRWGCLGRRARCGTVVDGRRTTRGRVGAPDQAGTRGPDGAVRAEGVGAGDGRVDADRRRRVAGHRADRAPGAGGEGSVEGRRPHRHRAATPRSECPSELQAARRHGRSEVALLRVR
jgi:hypothetical protein